MKLIVGLGNPGRQYQKTRHNAGFIIVDQIAKDRNIKIDKKKFNGLYGEFKYKDETIMLLKPQMFMNNSGQVVKKYIDYFKIELDDLLIIYDDYYIETGNYKIKANGSSAGHNGLKSVEKHLKTNEYKRIKIGISRDQLMMIPDYVLAKFTKEELKKIDIVKEKVASIVDNYLKYSFDKFMSLDG